MGFIYYYFNKNIESFIDITGDITGTMPMTNGAMSYWSNMIHSSQSEEEHKYNSNCTPGTTCNDNNQKFGIYNNNCECIPQIQQEEESNNILPSEEQLIDQQDLLYNDTQETQDSPDILDENCYPNSTTNFDTICKNENIKYGIKNMIPCNNENSKVVCGFNYINGKQYNEDVVITPCLNKTDDFNVWCRFYNDKHIPLGNSVNSIGAQNVLVGSLGGCFTNDGTPDENSARAVCDYKYIDQVTRLEPDNKEIDYNTYTRCLPINHNYFIPECKKLLQKDNKDNKNVLATQIMGYDCNPAYGRAKCIFADDKYNFDNDFFTKMYFNGDNQGF